jgi:hypothetical protein
MSLSPRALCMRCGVAKKSPYAQCPACGFEPRNDADLVKSVYLSVGRFEDGDDQARYATQLIDLSSALRAGGSVEYVSSELSRLSQQLTQVRSVSPSAAWGTVARLFLPALLFLALLWGVVWLLRSR